MSYWWTWLWLHQHQRGNLLISHYTSFYLLFLRLFTWRIGWGDTGRLTDTPLPWILLIACKGGLASSSRSGGILNGLILESLNPEDQRVIVRNINTKEVHMVVCPLIQRDADTLYRIISYHVEITSTIHTDCWWGCNGLMFGGFATHFIPFCKCCNRCSHEYDWITMEIILPKIERGGIRKNYIDEQHCRMSMGKGLQEPQRRPFSGNHRRYS